MSAAGQSTVRVAGVVAAPSARERVSQRRRVEPGTDFLLTNGLGGYALADVRGINTRRYDGLLVAAAEPPVGRIVALHSVMDWIVIGGRAVSLATQQFGGEAMLHPDGHTRLVDVDVRPPHSVRWIYRIDEIQVVRTLMLVPGRNAAHIEYEISGEERVPITLRVRPLTPLRDYHSLGRAWEVPPLRQDAGRHGLRVRRGSLGLELKASSGTWAGPAEWWYYFAYVRDRERGQEWHEDVWSPGILEATPKLSRGVQRLTLSVELVEPHHTVRRSRASASRVINNDETFARLVTAGDQFVVSRRVGNELFSSVIAGYPWFADWGRDAMISLPGLMLATGRAKEAADTLVAFARHMSPRGAGASGGGGLVPNRFDDYTGRPHYNTVDASLWFINAVCALDRCKRIRRHRTELLDACRTIIDAYRHGTDYDIRMDDDGLIAAGSPSTQLTWMDAQREGVTFTPRHGKPVEINALWHNALLCMATMTPSKREEHDLRTLAALVAASFREAFWWSERCCLYDVLMAVNHRGGRGEGGAGKNTTMSSAISAIGVHLPWRAVNSESRAVRPNQIFAVSLPHSPLTREQQRSVLSVVKECLLTPYGLRTLEPGHPAYRGRFEGDLMKRDGAYHQGTVWPWLIGPYCEALLRVNDFSDDAKREVRQTLRTLIAELDRGCLGQIAEVYDGDPPHRAGGCPAQAWSVAEVLRVWALAK